MNSKKVNETVNRLVSFLGDVKDGDVRTILSNMQKMNDYLVEKIRIYETGQCVQMFMGGDAYAA